jgi:signal transduction histidine kinase
MGDPGTRVTVGRGARPSLRWFVAAASVLTLAMMAPMVWHILHSYRTCTRITESYMAGEELRDAICHANAELLLDARARVAGDADGAVASRAAAAADLSSLIATARTVRVDCDEPCWLTCADSLAAALREMETVAIDLAHHGHTAEAHALLTAPSYAMTHDAFHDAVDGYAARFKARMQDAIAAERRRELNVMAVAAVTVWVSVAVWTALLRMLERWRRGMLREARVRADAERRLALSLQRFRRLFNNAHDAAYLVSAADGVIVDANLAARGQTGFSRRRLRTLRFADLDAAPPAGDGGRGPVPGPGLVEGRHRRLDGSDFPVEVGVQPMDDPSGPMVLCTVRDVSERKELEEQLGRTQQMECVGRLAAGVAHDFGNILLAVSGFAGAGRRRLPTGHPADASLANIEVAADQAAALTRSLLHFADRTAGRIEPVDLRALVRGALVLLEPALPRRVALDDTGVDGPPVWVDTDPHRLQQAVLNLGLNARDAMAGGGRLSVAVVVDDDIDEAGPLAQVIVADEGPGIPEAVRHRLGEPFFTTRGASGGCGLGLFNVATIMAECGGRLDIDSIVGEGATFRLVLPCREAPDTDAGSAVPDDRPAAVLLVMADELVCGLAADALGGDGDTVMASATAAGAVDMLLGGGGCDVAVIDGGLPPGELAACLAMLAELAPEASQVVAGGEPGDLPNGAAGSAVVLPGPFTMAELRDVVARAAHAETAADARRTLEGRS